MLPANRGNLSTEKSPATLPEAKGASRTQEKLTLVHRDPIVARSRKVSITAVRRLRASHRSRTGIRSRRPRSFGSFWLNIKPHLTTAWELTLEFIASLVILTLVMFGLWLVSFGLLAPVTLAGYTRALLRIVREGRDPKIQDLFADMRKFLPLLLLAAIVVLVCAMGVSLMILPGILIAFLVTYGFLYVLPLMVDKDLAVIPAIRESFSLAMRRPLTDQLIVTLIYMALIAIGGSVFIGALFTQPLATLFLLSVYNHRVQ